MFKDIRKGFCVATLIGGMVLAAGSAGFANQVNIFVNGNIIESEQPAFLEEQSKITYVPLRQTAEALNYSVTWDNARQVITLERGGKVIQLAVGSDKAVSNGQETMVSAPVKLQPETNRSVVPLRFFEDVLQCQLKISATAGVGIFEEVRP